VFAAEWQKREDALIFIVSANAFLYHMVRRLVSSQVEVGQAKMLLEDFRQQISSPQGMIQGLAPAQGLCLVEVAYA
jgi:tRNA pseudouridine38-40 synthase